MKVYKTVHKWFINLSVGIKMTILICFACFLVLGFELWARNSVYKAYNEQIYRQTAQSLNVNINYLEMEFEQLEQLTLSIIGDDVIQKSLTEIRKNPAAYNVYTFKDKIENALINYERTLDHNYALAIRLKDGTLVGKQEGFIYRKQYEPTIKVAENKQGRLLLSFFKEDILLVREIREIDEMTFNNIGTILLKVPFSRMMKGLEIYQNGKKIDLELSLFENGQCIFSSAEDSFLLKEKNSWEIVDDFFVVQRYSKGTGLIFQIRIPFDSVKAAVSEVNRNSVLSMCLIAMLIATCGSVIIFYIMRHIKVLIDRFDEYGKGMELNEQIAAVYNGRKDEIGILHNAFTQMAVQHKKVTDDYYNNLLLLKEAQLSQLQIQMRPHFLYNSLASITWLAYENDDIKVAQMAEKLGKLLRRTVRNDQRIVTVREELETVRDYLYIQQFRYSERLLVEIDCPEALLDVPIPTMTLQPIVENAIIYVVEKSLEPCSIKIFGTVHNNRVEIYVEDSGGNIDEEIIQNLQTGKTVAKGNGVGLTNIDRRIKILFSDAYGLKISCKDGYSRVTVQLPYNIAQGEEEKRDERK